MPDELHETLRRRAAARGVSLRQYALEILREHCELPTMEEWLDGLESLAPLSTATPTAEAVRQAREADEALLVDALRRP